MKINDEQFYRHSMWHFSPQPASRKGLLVSSPFLSLSVRLSVRLSVCPSVSLSQIQFPFIIFRTIIDIELKFGIQLEHYKI